MLRINGELTTFLDDIEFKDKDTYNHFLMLLSTLETNLEDLANYATDMRKLVVKK